MKKLFSIIILLGATLGVSAQKFINSPDRPARLSEVIPLDTAYMECIYQYIFIDSGLHRTVDDYKILQIGPAFSKYFDYGMYQLDSIITVDYKNNITRNQFHELAASYSTSLESTVKNLTEAKTTTYERVFIDNYVYEEPISLMEWTLMPGSEQVCGYTCSKATTSFRGRDWTVWYCPDIPVDNGPWKFGGLPGLILKAESGGKDHRFEAVAIRQAKELIGHKKKWYIPNTRKKVNEEMKEYRTNPGKFMAGTVMAPRDKDGNVITTGLHRFAFNPLELE